MEFKEKYTLDKTQKGEENKTELSPEYFALCEMIGELKMKIEHARQSFLTKK